MPDLTPELATVLAAVAGAFGLLAAEVLRRASARHRQASADLKAASQEWRRLGESATQRLARAEDDLRTLDAKVLLLTKDLNTERVHSAEQDRRLDRIRRALEAWTEWGRDLIDRWPEHRLSETPPPLPDVPDDI